MHELKAMDNLINPINQTKAHDRTSNKYKFVSTESILDRLATHGWTVRQSSEVRCRNKTHEGFQKHLVRLENERFKLDDLSIEVLLTNSHLGNSSVRLNIGIYRFICANGLVVGTSFFEERVRHVGFTYDKLDVALNNLLTQAPKVFEIVAEMKSKELNKAQMLDMARSFASRRLNQVENIISIDYQRMFDLYRQEDKASDLFTTYNILQEKVIRGGIKYVKSSKVLDTRTGLHVDVESSHTTRKIKNIDAVIKLNKDMFDITSEFLKAA